MFRVINYSKWLWQTKQSNVICDIMFWISNKRLLIFKPMRKPSTYWHLRASNYFWSQFCFHFSIKQRLFMHLFLAIYKVLRISFVNNPLLAKELCSRPYLLKLPKRRAILNLARSMGLKTEWAWPFIETGLVIIDGLSIGIGQGIGFTWTRMISTLINLFFILLIKEELRKLISTLNTYMWLKLRKSINQNIIKIPFTTMGYGFKPN